MADPIHPGEILKEELEVRGVSANRLALDLRVPGNRITSILSGKRAVTADTALRLERHFGNSASFWMNLQAHYDIEVAEQARRAEIRRTAIAA